MGIKRITAPSVAPLTLQQVKDHLRVDHSDTDSIIGLYLDAATAYVDGEFGFLGRALVTQTWELTIDAFPTHEIKIPLPPLQSVESIKYDDAAGAEQTLVASTDYYVDASSEPAWIVPATGGWPTSSSVFDGINAVRVRFIAGYEPTTDSPPDLRANVPTSVKQALLLLIGNFHEHREENIVGLTTMKLPFAAENLLRPYRVVVPFA
jgi:uncharacterized phiE125 gp8 family phage protein